MVEPSTFILGDTIDLRPANPERRDLYIKWLNDHTERKLGRVVFPVTLEQYKEEFEKGMREKKIISFEVWHKADNRPIGQVNLFQLDWPNRKASMGMVIGEKEYQNKGIGTEVTRLILQYVFEELNLHRLEVFIFEPNLGSKRCAEKAGFQREATLKESVFIDGKYHDTVVYAIFDRNWFSEKKKKKEENNY